MRTALLFVTASLVGFQAADAQPVKQAVHQVTMVTDGQLFSVTLKVDPTGRPADTGHTFHPQLPVHQPQPVPKPGVKAPVGKLPDKLGEKEVTRVTQGVHVFHVTCAQGVVPEPYGSHFPQPVIYKVTGPVGYSWASEPTTQPIAIDIRPGQKVAVHVLRPQESFNAKFGQLYGVPVALVVERPYWSQGLAARKGEEREPLPNSLTFMVHKDWGCGKVSAALAANVMENGGNPNFISPGSYSSLWFRACVALGPEGKINESLLKLNGKDRDRRMVERDLAVEFARLCKAWQSEKVYVLNPTQADNLRRNGLLPRNLGDGPFPVAEALKLAEQMIVRWESM